MRMDGRRESGNVDDRRGQRSGGTFGSGLNGGNIFGSGRSSGSSGSGNGLSILSLIISLISLFKSSKNSGGSNRGNGNGKSGCSGCGCIGLIAIVVVGYLLISSLGVEGLGGLLNNAVVYDSNDQSGTTTSDYVGSDEEEELATFAKQVFAGTEDVWTELFAKMGRTYECPRLVLFTDKVSSGCGSASSSTGPFYCSADQSVYIDLSFFQNMKKTIGADGDFAYAYVIAHEVGHHVQYLLGDLTKIHSMQARSNETTSNQLSVRLELQADFYAGVWAYHDNKMFNSLEDGDIEEAINAAQKIGDDYLQKQAYGYTVPESFNHGTSAQRSKWLKKGVQTGNISLGDTFSPNYNSL